MILTCTHEPSETEREEKRLGGLGEKENKNFNVFVKCCRCKQDIPCVNKLLFVL